MEELLAYVARELVSHPDDVEVSKSEREGAMVLELRVAQSDLGKVIGRQGRIARALRTLARASGARTGERVLLEIVE